MTLKLIAALAIGFAVVSILVMYVIMPHQDDSGGVETIPSYLKEKKAECNKCLEDNSPLFQKCDLNNTAPETACRKIMVETCFQKCSPVITGGWY